MQQLSQGALLQSGKYRIEKVLGQGGFGITYLAYQPLLDRKVCIKEFFYKDYCERNEATSHVTLGTQSSQELVHRFMNKFIKEAQTISRQKHANIIDIYDIFTENNTAYYVMEYIEGESLSEMVKRGGALPEAVAIGYIRQVAQALSYIHAKSINHLDIKPANIMVRKSDNSVVLIDFGLSKQYDSTGGQTSSTPVGISEGYAPLEQYQMGGVSTFTPQTDIYSLGATLYYLVTGTVPPSASEVLNNGIPALPDTVSAITMNAIHQAMQFRKNDRPESVIVFLKLLSGSKDASAKGASKVDNEETKVIGVTLVEELLEQERQRKEQESKAAREKAAREKRAREEELDRLRREKEEAERKQREAEELARQKEEKKGSKFPLILTISVVVIIGSIWFCNNGNNDASSQGPSTVVETPVVMEETSVTDKMIVLNHGHESKRNYVYTGEVNSKGLPEGNGKAQYPETKSSSSASFIGVFKNGIPVTGELIFASKYRYNGTFDSNGNYVKGKLWDPEGYYFQGTFYNGQPYNGSWYTPKGIKDSDVINGK